MKTLKTMVIVLSLLFPFAGQAGLPPGGLDPLCDMMWVVPLPPSRTPALMQEVRKNRHNGGFVAAAKAWEAGLKKILSKGEAQLRDPGSPVNFARSFLDEYVTSKAPLLEVRGDLLTLTLPVGLWAAWLHCRAGNPDQARAYLNAAWRDHGRKEIRSNLFLLALRYRRLDEAKRWKVEKPVGWRAKALVGLYSCMTGKVDEGRAMMTKARDLAPEQRHKDAIQALIKDCKAP